MEKHKKTLLVGWYLHASDGYLYNTACVLHINFVPRLTYVALIVMYFTISSGMWRMRRRVQVTGMISHLTLLQSTTSHPSTVNPLQNTLILLLPSPPLPNPTYSLLGVLMQL